MAETAIKITDTTFRDGHQSLIATRLRTEDMVPIAEDMDSVGFYSMEVWGGATFDSATRFLAEDPWERLRILKKLMPNTPLTMLLRGQSLVGYRPYPNDVVEAFVQRSAEVGIDIFRVFDGLNDEWNLEAAVKAVKKSGKHLQLAICYSITEEGRLGGPIYNLDYFSQKAELFQEMGADSICLKDMGGLMAPYDAHELVSTLKRLLHIPLQFHAHYTSGMASMSYLKAIEAGADVVDTCLAPLALRTAQPAIEPLVASLRGKPRDSGLDLDKLLEMGDYLESILPKYRDHMQSPRAAVIDTRVLSHQIPGGMASNLISQLREADALDRLDEVLEEIPRVRKEMGYPPLVTPMSQMVGTQAVSNVLMGRYHMVSSQLKDYVYGLYGRPPARIDTEIARQILKDDERGQSPNTTHPADHLEPELDKARDDVKDLSTDIEDVLTYALYPTTGLRFLRMKYGLEPVPDEMKPKTLEQVRQEDEVKVRTPHAPPKSPRTRTFNVYVGGQYVQVEVDPVQGPAVSASSLSPAPADTASEPDAPPTAKASSHMVGPGEVTLVAPVPGIVVRYLVGIGQHVNKGDPAVVLEAMKMENSLPSPTTGTIRALATTPGSTVVKDDILVIIAE